MWDLIVSVPDHCLSFYFTVTNSSMLIRDFRDPLCRRQADMLGPHLDPDPDPRTALKVGKHLGAVRLVFIGVNRSFTSLRDITRIRNGRFN